MKAILRETALIDVDRIRRDFPLLTEKGGQMPPIYLDSAATSLKPQCVIDAVREFYEVGTANIGRGVHWLAEQVTEQFEEGREAIAAWFNAETREIVFVSNCTSAIRVVAEGRDWSPCVLVGAAEHHSNDLPWRGHGSKVNLAVDDCGVIHLEDLERCLEQHQPALVAVSMISNALGSVQPVAAIIEMAHHYNARVLVDASQAVGHRSVDVQELDCDFLCFSGHKMCGPTGVGVLYGKSACLAELAPAGYGGGAVEDVHESDFAPREIPWRFEAGTPNIEGVIGLARACEYLDHVGMEAIEQHVSSLTTEVASRLQAMPKVTVHGPPVGKPRGALVSFSVAGLESHAIARILSQRHRICVRSGYHCAQPLHETLAIPPTVRASFGCYTSQDDVGRFLDAVDDLTKAL